MAKHILKCPSCENYTMKEECAECKIPTSLIKPLKYSPEDPYGEYRRQAKRPELITKGLL